MPCPSIQLTEEEFQLQADVFTYVVLFTSFITVAMLLKLAQRFYVRTMFIIGFFVFAIVSLVFVYLNRNNEVVCSGSGHYLKRAPLCVFQASVFVFSIIWVQCWSVILAIDAYLHIMNRINPQHTLWRRKVYLGLSLSTSIVCTIIPLGANNLGFDPYANIPFCLYLFSDHKQYFWATLFIPFCVLNLACSCITIAGAIQIQSVLVLSKTPDLDDDNTSTGSMTSSQGRLMSGHKDDYCTSFGDSAGTGASYSKHIVDVIQSRSQNLATESSLTSERDISVINPSALDVPLIEPIFAPYRESDYSERESISEYAVSRRNNTSIDPECLTNVTNAIDANGTHLASLERSIYSDANHGAPTVDQDASNSTNLFFDSASRNWFRQWSNDLMDEKTVRGKRIKNWEYILRKTIKYNGRTMLFLIMFCLTTLFVAPILIYLQYIKYDIYMDSGDDFVECLVQASIQCEDQTQSGVDACGKDACGEHPGKRPNVVEVIMSP